MIDEWNKESKSMCAYNVYFVGVHKGTYYGYIHTNGKRQFVHFDVHFIQGYVRASKSSSSE